jgi:arabinogalactan endo-1,4-beta-galactosidase
LRRRTNNIIWLTFFLFAFACTKNQPATPQNPVIPVPPPNPPAVQSNIVIRASDISFLPEIEAASIQYKSNGEVQDPLLTLKNAGCNFLRLRLWHTPSNGRSNLLEVKSMVSRIQKLGMQVWLTMHYSDSWADPGKQTKPDAWKSLGFTDLKTAVSTYTSSVLSEIQPDIIQIGNETNDGFLWPDGKISANEMQSLQLFQAASASIRNIAPKAKILLHYGGLNGSEWFFEKVKGIDYDYAGISYYPIYHGTSLTALGSKIKQLAGITKKKVLVAETAYPFTLGWNDWTNNIIGDTAQLISAYPPTPLGQKEFLQRVKAIGSNQTYGAGFCYWGGEYIAYKGNTSPNGSSWENQALWDFNAKALPALEVFK